MSTNSTIRMVLPTGKATKPSYVHWDGYPEYMMENLKNYDTIEKVEELLALGNLSILGERVKPDENEKHSFEQPSPGVTVAYHRDRGEALSFTDGREQYNYLFDGKEWKITSRL